MAYAGPTITTSSAPSIASAMSLPAYRIGAKPSRSPFAVMPPAASIAARCEPNSGGAYSDDLVTVLGEVERRGDPSVTRSENCDPHPDLPP